MLVRARIVINSNVSYKVQVLVYLFLIYYSKKNEITERFLKGWTAANICLLLTCAILDSQPIVLVDHSRLVLRAEAALLWDARREVFAMLLGADSIRVLISSHEFLGTQLLDLLPHSGHKAFNRCIELLSMVLLCCVRRLREAHKQLASRVIFRVGAEQLERSLLV